MRSIVKKIKKPLFVRRVETENKWWHRLALVLIYGSATLAVLFWIGLAIDEISDWEKYKSYSYAYSFEQGYEFLDGEEISCALNFNFGGRLPTLPPSFSQHCGDQAEIIRKYNDFVRSVLLTDEIKNKCANLKKFF